MVTVDQAEAEPTMAAEIATAVFMVIMVLPSASKSEQRWWSSPPKSFTHIMNINIRIDGWLRIASVMLVFICIPTATIE